MRTPVLLLVIVLIFQFQSSSGQTTGKPFADTALEPEIFGYTDNEMYGAIGNKIYLKTGNEIKWNYAFVLPFATDSGSLSMKDYKTILFSRFDDSLFYYSIADAKVQKREKKEMLEAFCKSGIHTLIFSKGSQGCFHIFWDEMIYEQRNGEFQLAGKKANGTKHTSLLTDNGDEIDQQMVEEFVKGLPAIYQKQASVDELGFTQEEYDACKRNILKFKRSLEDKSDAKEEKEGSFTMHGNKLNFEKLIALVDSIKTLDKNVLNKYLLFSSDIVSTSSFWVKIILVNTKNERLIINNNYYRPNAFYFPWQIELNSSKSTNTAIEINKFVAAVYPDFLGTTNKVELLHQLVKSLYRNQ
jgi:hypothetical protein